MAVPETQRTAALDEGLGRLPGVGEFDVSLVAHRFDEPGGIQQHRRVRPAGDELAVGMRVADEITGRRHRCEAVRAVG